MSAEERALLPATPEDREAAWCFIPNNSIAGQDREGFFAGKYDAAVAVQAFAAHRIAAYERGKRDAAEAPVDVRGLALAAIKRNRAAGESQEMLAREISGAVKPAYAAAILSLKDTPK